jgi:hypothetical protein
VEVNSKKGIIQGLQREDFVVFDNGRPQKILGFQSESPALDIILLLDVSGSMAKSFPRLRALALDALQQLRKDDRVGIIAFAKYRLLVLPPTEDHVLASAELKLLDVSNSSTELNENVIESARYLSEVARPRAQTAVLIFSDSIGFNTINKSRALDLLGERDVLLHLIQFYSGVYFAGDLPSLVSASGGQRTWSNSSSADLQKLFRRMRERYQISYAPPPSPPGSRHKIEIRFAKSPTVLEAKSRGAAWRLHHRSGYTVSARHQLR